MMVFSLAYAAVDVEHGEVVYQKKCAACHGVAGVASVQNFPSLAGQNASFLTEALYNYRQGRQKDVIMTPIAEKLSDQDITDLVAYTHGFKAPTGAVDPALRARGEQLFRAGDRQKGIPACSGCHDPSGVGRDEEKTPRLAGQNAQAIVIQLDKFAEGTRQGIHHNHAMETIAKRLSPEDKQAVASFASGLQPEG